MAVQAHYHHPHPSNLLHLHRNNDCSFVDDQASNQILFTDFPVGNNNGSNNSRKVIREIDIDMNQSMSLLHQHQQQQQQFRNHQNVDVSTGLRLAHSVSSQCSALSFLSDELSSQINQQRDEIDRFLHAQGEELRRMLANKRHADYCSLIRAAESSIMSRMKEKDTEVEKAKRRNIELEARAAHLSAEAQVWEARARAQELEAVALQSQLEQAIVSRSVGSSLAEREGVGQRCAVEDVEDAESAYVDPERVVLVSGPGCKACGKRVASVVLLPCRHLCVCTECDGVVSSCPSCLSFRSSSIEVYMS